MLTGLQSARGILELEDNLTLCGRQNNEPPAKILKVLIL